LGKPAIVRDEEIGTIKKWLETPDEYDVAVDAIQIGDKITLDSGPFSAQEAIVREVNKTHYVLVLASFRMCFENEIKAELF
jgi:transcription antitermination factor NusG